MHVLYVHQHFTTNTGMSGTRSYDYAKYLIQAGHKVTVITGLYGLGPFVGEVHRLFETRLIDGIKVVIVNIPYANKMGFTGRVLSFLSFALLSVVACLRQGRVDVVLATSTPLTVGIPALEEFARRGIDRVKVAVGSHNKPANGFYVRHGFGLATTRMHHGLGMNVYTISTTGGLRLEQGNGPFSRSKPMSDPVAFG